MSWIHKHSWAIREDFHFHSSLSPLLQKLLRHPSTWLTMALTPREGLWSYSLNCECEPTTISLEICSDILKMPLIQKKKKKALLKPAEDQLNYSVLYQKHGRNTCKLCPWKSFFFSIDVNEFIFSEQPLFYGNIVITSKNKENMFIPTCEPIIILTCATP